MLLAENGDIYHLSSLNNLAFWHQEAHLYATQLLLAQNQYSPDFRSINRKCSLPTGSAFCTEQFNSDDIKNSPKKMHSTNFHITTSGWHAAMCDVSAQCARIYLHHRRCYC